MKELKNMKMPQEQFVPPPPEPPPSRRAFWIDIPVPSTMNFPPYLPLIAALIFSKFILEVGGRILFHQQGSLIGFERARYMTIDQVARSLYYSKSSIRRFIHSGKLHAVRKNGRFYLLPQEVEKFRSKQIKENFKLRETMYWVKINNQKWIN